MRHAFAILLCVFLLKSNVFSQSDTTTVLKDSVRTVVVAPPLMPRSVQIIETIGVVPLPYKSLNGVLRQSRYTGTDEFTPDWAGGFLSIGLEMQYLFTDSTDVQGSFILGFSYASNGVFKEGRPSPETSKRQIALADFSRSTIDFGGSMAVFKTQTFSLYPFFLISPEANRLHIKEGSTNRLLPDFDTRHFDDHFNDTTRIVQTTLTSGSLSIQGGAGADLSLYTFFKDDYSRQPLSLMLSIRASYQFGLFSTTWRSGNFEALNGPDVSTNGLRLSAGFGMSVLNRIFKAKIISEEK